MSNVYINSDRFNDGLDKLTSIKSKMQKIYESQCIIVKNISEYWNGNTGEEVYNELNNHKDIYVSFIDEIDEKIKFLESVKSSYSKLDNNLNENASKYFK